MLPVKGVDPRFHLQRVAACVKGGKYFLINVFHALERCRTEIVKWILFLNYRQFYSRNCNNPSGITRLENSGVKFLDEFFENDLKNSKRREKKERGGGRSGKVSQGV